VSEVITRPLESWQKRDCLFCSELATRAVVLGSSSIRCCDKLECFTKARALAQTWERRRRLETGS